MTNIARKRPKKEIVHRPLDSLKLHPAHALFPELPEHEFQALAADIDANGLLDPVEILPDGTLLAGRERRRAVRLLGGKTIACWLRKDLAEAGPDAIERRVIESNLDRRQLSRLDQARCFRRLRELARGELGARKVQGDLRDFLAKRFGMSGRNMVRYEHVLDTPIEVQTAVESERLKLVDGEKVAGLPADDQERIAEALRRGQDPRKVVREAVKRRRPEDGEPCLSTVVARLARAIEAADRDLPGCLRREPLGDLRPRLPALLNGRTLLETLIRVIEKHAKSLDLPIVRTTNNKTPRTKRKPK